MNRLQFTTSKVVVTINNPSADLFIRQTFPAKHMNKPNILPAKLSHYTVSFTGVVEKFPVTLTMLQQFKNDKVLYMWHTKWHGKVLCGQML